MSTLVADTIVIGLGAFGSAVTYQLARRGTSVIGIDRYSPPHDMGSSHGATRITRLAVGEGTEYVPLVKRSNEIWRILEAEFNERLYLPTGGLIMGPADGQVRHHGKPDFVRRTIDVAVKYGITHEVLRAKEISERFPQFMVRGDEMAYYEPEAGVLKPERSIAAQLEAARRHGARIRTNEQVLSLESSPSGATVRTSSGVYSARHVVLATGAWVPRLAGGAYKEHLRVLRQALYWFKPTQPELFASPGCPVFIWMHGSGDEDYLYGFPMVDGHTGVKVATEQYRVESDADEVEHQVRPEEAARMYASNVSGRLRSVTAECVNSAACMYTVSTDSRFIVDSHPTLDNVTVISACSGHGFKHSAGLGEVVAQHVLGEAADVDLGAFSLSRFSRSSAAAT